MTARRGAGCLLLALGLAAGCGGTKTQSAPTRTSATTRVVVTLTDRLLRSEELPGTKLDSVPDVYKTPRAPIWTG